MAVRTGRDLAARVVGVKLPLMWIRDWLARREGRSPAVTLIQAIQLVNALPAFVNLMSIPGRTERFFVWTVQPAASARARAARLAQPPPG